MMLPGILDQTRVRSPHVSACSVVLADDDDDFRATAADALRSEGAHVIEASGGAVAIAVLDQLARSRQRAPALMVMDLMMPLMSGFEALQRLRRSPRWARLPVVIMTGVNDPMLPVRLNVPVVYKPDIETLLIMVRKIAGS